MTKVLEMKQKSFTIPYLDQIKIHSNHFVDIFEIEIRLRGNILFMKYNRNMRNRYIKVDIFLRRYTIGNYHNISDLTRNFICSFIRNYENYFMPNNGEMVV